MKAISLLSLFLIAAPFAVAQIDQAQQAIDNGEYVRAVSILSEALADRPTPDAYIYLGRAYTRMKEYQQAEDVLNEGVAKYPEDARFHNELAKLFLENNDAESAKTQLRRALLVDENNAYASDLLATINLSEGDVQSALRSWNKSRRPVIHDILHNYYFDLESWVERSAVGFHPGNVLHYYDWKTTQWRLFESGAYSNVGIEVEPTPVEEQYNVVIRTSARTNSPSDFLFNAVKFAPAHTSFVDVWNIGNTGMNFNGAYRWETNRRRVQGGLKIPLPLFGLTYVELANTWRSERWDVSRVIRPEFLSSARFDYKANALQVFFKSVPSYRVEVGWGFEYINRAAKGNLPQLFTDTRNVGKFAVETNIRFVDGRYQNLLHLEGFAARRNLIGYSQFRRWRAESKHRVRAL